MNQINNDENTDEQRKKDLIKELHCVVEFCEDIENCQRTSLLEYLGEPFDDKKCKETCGNCISKVKLRSVDMTTCAKFILELVKLRDEDSKFGLTKTNITNLCFAKEDN